MRIRDEGVGEERLMDLWLFVLIGYILSFLCTCFENMCVSMKDEESVFWV